MTLAWIAAGGFIGAITRFAIGSAVKQKYHPGFPFATLFINLTGAFLLGLLLGAELKVNVYAFAGIGFLGAFTTFSTFKVEILNLIKEDNKKEAYLYIIVSYTGGLSAALCGLVLMEKMF